MVSLDLDNFDLIKSLLHFESEDDFYFVQIIQRKKDNPGIVKGSNNNNRLIKAYYIRSTEHLDKYKEEMIALAELFNARVGINLNKRSFYKTAFNTLKKIAEQMHNKSFLNVHRAYNTSCGVLNSSDRVWLLDVDDSKLLPNIYVYLKVMDIPYTVIPTPNGVHLIVKAFDSRGFEQRFPNVEIHKNNPTILYAPISTIKDDIIKEETNPENIQICSVCKVPMTYFRRGHNSTDIYKCNACGGIHYD